MRQALHAGGRWSRPGLGRASGFLQSSLRTGDFQVGAEMLGGKPQAGHPLRDAYTRPDGHLLFPRLHLPPGRDPFHPGAATFRRLQGWRTLPVYGSNLQVSKGA